MRFILNAEIKSQGMKYKDRFDYKTWRNRQPAAVHLITKR
jgi:hypothetical protein